MTDDERARAFSATSADVYLVCVVAWQTARIAKRVAADLPKLPAKTLRDIELLRNLHEHWDDTVPLFGPPPKTVDDLPDSIRTQRSYRSVVAFVKHHPYCDPFPITFAAEGLFVGVSHWDGSGLLNLNELRQWLSEVEAGIATLVEDL